MSKVGKRIVSQKLAAEEKELYSAIGEFIFWFSQLELTIKGRLAGAVDLDKKNFDIIIGPYDFSMLCTVAQRVLCKGASVDVQKRVESYFNRCRGLNQQARIVVAHGNWTLSGARHVSRNKLEAAIHFKNPEDIRKQTTEAKMLMRDLFNLGAVSKIEAGGDNIFADLGLPDAENHLLKAQIVSEVYRLAGALKLTQAQTGKRLGISQPEVSRLFKGHFREYSIERLMSFLTSFDRDVEIVVRPRKKAGKAGKITFNAVAA